MINAFLNDFDLNFVRIGINRENIVICNFRNFYSKFKFLLYICMYILITKNQYF